MKSDKNVHEIKITVDKDVPGHFGDQKYYNGYISQEDKGKQ